MEWKGRRQSRNVEDRRMMRGSTGAIGGLGLVAVVVVSLLLGVDPRQLLEATGMEQDHGGTPADLTPSEQAAAEFVSVTLADTEQIWTRLFADQLNAVYDPAVLVLFKNSTSSPCGQASQATGPFYCPQDRKVYLDTGFFGMMRDQLGAEGDFAAAYVVAHEIAHHVQDEIGILGKANQVRGQVSEAESNRISVMIELQADCLSGVWAHWAKASLGTIEAGDFDEAVHAAQQIGDDRLQEAAGRRVQPETFTHGTSQQRAYWFTQGLRSGQIAQCDTYSAPDL
ncbi:KPN_02809 family neutral zinc metallopeptidase [Xinfangfangia pollutisoli]|uniref:KPN_02809 family neutral zinc metallopeptidase n=1 Tax=Xinfangfangia pollutisoli TaxID=2865960 RepID=UPI001CD27656|nr:neutral zinc metallopeptidase [Xinfangfangia pollutisoli]